MFQKKIERLEMEDRKAEENRKQKVFDYGLFHFEIPF